MSRPKTVVVAGAGLAGAKAAETLREDDRDHLADTSVALGDLLPAAAQEA